MKLARAAGAFYVALDVNDPFEAPRAPAIEPGRARMRRWRILMFFATWLTYVVFYLTRKNYSVAQPAFMSELGWGKDEVGVIVTTYLTVYAAGQFVNGYLGDRLGSRMMIAFGFVLTAAMSLLLGLQSSIVMMAVLYGINGYAQSIGWPSVTKAMTTWTPLEQRGQVMGFWGTNYPVGDAIATALATAILAAYGWRASFVGPAILSLGVGALIVLVFRNHPRDVFGGPSEEAKRAAAPKTRPLVEVITFKVLTLGAAYFCLKFVRYTFTFWFGIYLVEVLGFSTVEAGYLQVPFPLAGLVGSIAAGAISDRMFAARRAPVSAIMLGGLVLALVGLLVSPASLVLIGVVYGAAGFFLFGPDMLISGTSAMDFGDEDAAATVAGFVNGMGAIGAAISGVAVGLVSEHFGWKAVFGVLIVMVLSCGGVVATLWNARGRA